MSITDSPIPSPVIRRLMAMMYDWMLLVALLFLASIIPVVAAGIDTDQHPLKPLFYAYIYFCAYLFYGWFWTHGGQTLGLRTWRLQIMSVNNKGGIVSWWESFKRYTIAWVYLLSLMAGIKGQLNDNSGLMAAGYGLFGALLLWSLIRKDHGFLHDDVSGTVCVLLPKPSTNAPDD